MASEKWAAGVHGLYGEVVMRAGIVIVDVLVDIRMKEIVES